MAKVIDDFSPSFVKGWNLISEGMSYIELDNEDKIIKQSLRSIDDILYKLQKYIDKEYPGALSEE